MKNLRTMIELTQRNDIFKIRNWKITTDELVKCVGELNKFDRHNIALFEKYRAGDGTVKQFEAAAALQCLADKVPKQQDRLVLLGRDFEERTGRSSHGVTPEEQLAALVALDAKHNKINRAA